MHVRHGHPCAAPARALSWRTGLCLALGSCLIAATAQAQTGTGTGSNSGNTSGNTMGSGGMGSAQDPRPDRPLIGAGEAPAAGTLRGSAIEPSLAAQDQHGTGGS